MTAAFRVELIKLTRSRVGLIASLVLVGGILSLLMGITAGIAGGNAQLIAQAGPAGTLDWFGLLAGSHQITAVAAILGFGVVMSWIFGREFSEGTIVALFALPISRMQIARAKFAVYLLWACLISCLLTAGTLLAGLALGYGPPAADTWASLARLLLLGILSAGLAVPAAWIATITRSMLAAVGATIAIVVIAQVASLAGAGAWMPLAAPGLWAMSNGAAVIPLQLALSLTVPLAFGALTFLGWSRLQLDR